MWLEGGEGKDGITEVQKAGSVLDSNLRKPPEDFKQRSDLILKQEIGREVCGDMTVAFLISR